MRVKLSNRLRGMLSKHFAVKILPQVTEPLEATKHDIETFWE